MGGCPAGGGGPDDPERKAPEDAVLTGGGDHRLPAEVGTDPRKLARLAQKASVQLQRAANRMMSRSRQLKLFGPQADPNPRHDDQVGVQLLFEMRETIKCLEDIDDLEPPQRIVAIRTRLNALQAMGQLNQAMLSEVARVTANTQQTLLGLARLALDKNKNADDDITDAELA